VSGLDEDENADGAGADVAGTEEETGVDEDAAGNGIVAFDWRAATALKRGIKKCMSIKHLRGRLLVWMRRRLKYKKWPVQDSLAKHLHFLAVLSFSLNLFADFLVQYRVKEMNFVFFQCTKLATWNTIQRCQRASEIQQQR